MAYPQSCNGDTQGLEAGFCIASSGVIHGSFLRRSAGIEKVRSMKQDGLSINQATVKARFAELTATVLFTAEMILSNPETPG